MEIFGHLAALRELNVGSAIFQLYGVDRDDLEMLAVVAEEVKKHQAANELKPITGGP